MMLRYNQQCLVLLSLSFLLLTTTTLASKGFGPIFGKAFKKIRAGATSSSINSKSAFRSHLPKDLLDDYDRLHSDLKEEEEANEEAPKPGAAKKKWNRAADWYPGKPDPVEGSVKVTYQYLHEFMLDALMSFGLSNEEAIVAADVLIEADKRGIYSHGIGRLKPIYCDRIDWGILYPKNKATIEKDHKAMAMVNGNLGVGLVIGPYCMQMAIDKAKEYGIGIVVAKNSTHYGIAGYYATMATQQGCIGFSTTNARPSIAPTFGVQGMMGTNPLCFGIPSDEAFPFVIDCATSVNQRGKIEKYARDGVTTPYGQVIDIHGNVRTDTDNILIDLVKGNCALCPIGGSGDSMGGYKGYGWALAAELLCTAFQHGPYGEEICGIDRVTGAKKSMSLGHVFIAIDITKFTSLDKFTKSAGDLLRTIRSSTKDPQGPQKIWTAGEPEYNHRLETNAALSGPDNSHGSFYIPPALQQIGRAHV